MNNLPAGSGLPSAFRDERPWQTFSVTIFNDNIPEGVEYFNVTLSLDDSTGQLGSNVRVHPAVATVRIQYNDCKLLVNLLNVVVIVTSS